MPARRKETATPKAANVHVIVGSDEGLVKEAASALAAKLLPPGSGDFGLEVIDGAADNADDAARICARTVEALQTLPFCGGKLVWLKSVGFLADTVTGRAAATLDGLESLIGVLEAGVPGDVQFLLSASAVDKRRTFFLRLEKLARIEVHDMPDTRRRGWEDEVADTVIERSRALGLSFEPAALEVFVQFAGEQTRQIVSELEKLDLFLGPERRVATEEDVRAVVPLTRASVIFDVGNAVVLRDVRRALRLIDELFNHGEEAMGILLGGIVPKVRNLIHTRELARRMGLAAGAVDYPTFKLNVEALPAEETMHLPRSKDGGISAYPIFLTLQESERFTDAELRRALEACLKANLRMVTTGLDPRVIITELVIEILDRPPIRGAA